MQDRFGYCEALVREHERDRYLASLFAPHALRRFLHALYAFDVETAQVAARVNEPLAGEVRLQWWRDAVTGEGGEDSAVPVAAALIETIAACGLPRTPLLELIDTRREALYQNFAGGGFENWAARTHGNVFLLAAHILSAGAEGDAMLSRNAGIAYACLRNVRPDNATELAPICTRCLRVARERLVDVPERAGPAYLVLALIGPQMRRFERSGYGPDMLLPQWRRQWILWRAAGNLAARV